MIQEKEVCRQSLWTAAGWSGRRGLRAQLMGCVSDGGVTGAARRACALVDVW